MVVDTELLDGISSESSVEDPENMGLSGEEGTETSEDYESEAVFSDEGAEEDAGLGETQECEGAKGLEGC